jgi:hypothetical protein
VAQSTPPQEYRLKGISRMTCEATRLMRVKKSGIEVEGNHLTAAKVLSLVGVCQHCVDGGPVGPMPLHVTASRRRLQLKPV